MTRVGTPPSTLLLLVSLLLAVVTSTVRAEASSGMMKVSTSESASAVFNACFSVDLSVQSMS